MSSRQHVSLVSRKYRIVRILKKADRRSAGHQLVQQREPLGPEFNDEAVDARKVASRSIETSNKPKRYGIGADEEHNWDAGARRLSRESRKHARCDDHSHSKLDQISRQRWQS